MSKLRQITLAVEALVCKESHPDKNGKEIFTLATHGCRDAVQAADGSWSESGLRLGCAEHRVVPMVHMNTGVSMTFEDYRNTQGA